MVIPAIVRPLSVSVPRDLARLGALVARWVLGTAASQVQSPIDRLSLWP
jgi:hypothetical protein